MIIGIGSDIINIDRIESVIKKYGDRFIKRVYSQVEIDKSESRANRIASYAKRFAAKEACSKALGTGFRKGVFMKDLCVVNLSSGKPTMKLSGGALERVKKISPDFVNTQIDLSITDEPPFAYALVIISTKK